MSALFGILGIDDTERVYANTLGQSVIYDAINEVLNRFNDEVDKALSVFVESVTEDHTQRYKLPGGGRLAKMSGRATSPEVKAYGGWDVAYPLEQWGASVGGSRVDLAYMTVQDLDRHIQTVMIKDLNTVRFELLRRLFNSGTRSFADELHGTLTIQPLANGDGVLYPPIVGSESEATEDHYYHSGYTSANISDTNNPYKTIVDELEEHFGKPVGGSEIVTFINSAQTAKTVALTNFVEVQDIHVRPGDDTAVPAGLPSRVPGKIIGRMTDGAWVSEWNFIPSDYILGLHLAAPAPLRMRVDPSYTGLPRGLALVADSDKYPIKESHWEHRFGFGTGNRLNGVFLEFNASAFSIPTGYTY